MEVMKIRFLPYWDSDTSVFVSYENTDCIEMHLSKYIIGISLSSFSVWNWIWRFHKYSANDKYKRVIELELPTMGIMVLCND